MPKILIDLDIDDDLKNNIEEKLKNKNLLIKDYILELIQKDIEKTVDFNGYSYSFEFNKLLYEDKEVKFTTIENDLFRYLLNNANNIMSTDDIHLNIWKDKKMTLFTLRNIIRSIREKTYHKLIKNVSNRGYMMVIE
jgi:DNA-binding winged helix-turn-helix (wHTH) protein